MVIELHLGRKSAERKTALVLIFILRITFNWLFDDLHRFDSDLKPFRLFPFNDVLLVPFLLLLKVTNPAFIMGNLIFSWLPVLVIQCAKIDGVLGAQNDLEVEHFVFRVVVEFLEAHYFVHFTEAFDHAPVFFVIHCGFSKLSDLVSDVIAIERVCEEHFVSSDSICLFNSLCSILDFIADVFVIVVNQFHDEEGIVGFSFIIVDMFGVEVNFKLLNRFSTLFFRNFVFFLLPFDVIFGCSVRISKRKTKRILANC